jgi:type I restriction enzyme S subunit
MPEYCILRGGDIILSLTGNVGRVCLVYGENYLLNQRVAKLIPKNIADRAFVYSLYRNSAFQRSLEMISTGTAQQNLSPILMGKYNIIVPHRKVFSLFADLCNPILNEILLLYMKNKTLRQTRDLLLPKLISGKIDVSDLDIEIGET